MIVVGHLAQDSFVNVKLNAFIGEYPSLLSCCVKEVENIYQMALKREELDNEFCEGEDGLR